HKTKNHPMDNARAPWNLPTSPMLLPARVADRFSLIAFARTLALTFALTVALLCAFGSSARAADESTPRDALTLQAASDDRNAAAEALFFLGQQDERAMRFSEALGEYQACVAKSSSNRYAGRAINRADQLKAHSEGDFAPLQELERVRRDPKLASDAKE